MKGIRIVVGQGAVAEAIAADRNNKEIIFKNCAPFTDCVSKTNKTQVDNAKDLDVAMPMYILIEYSNYYSNTSGILWQYCRGEPDDNITDSESFKSKSSYVNGTDDDGTADVQKAAPLKYLENFWRTLEIPLINCETILIIIWSANCVI